MSFPVFGRALSRSEREAGGGKRVQKRTLISLSSHYVLGHQSTRFSRTSVSCLAPSPGLDKTRWGASSIENIRGRYGGVLDSCLVNRHARYHSSSTEPCKPHSTTHSQQPPQPSMMEHELSTGIRTTAVIGNQYQIPLGTVCQVFVDGNMSILVMPLGVPETIR